MPKYGRGSPDVTSSDFGPLTCQWPTATSGDPGALGISEVPLILVVDFYYVIHKLIILVLDIH
jgi:hypothetical protein